MTTKKRRSAKNPETSVKDYGVVPVQTVVSGRYSSLCVWVEQKARGYHPSIHMCPVLRITPKHVVIETLHTGIVIRSVPSDRFGYREVKIDKKTGEFVGVEENVRVVQPPEPS